MMRQQPARIAATLFCALALGMWIGAGWHASVHQLEDVVEAVSASECVCQHDSDPAGRIEALESHECLICQLGTTAPDLQTPQTFLMLPEPALVAAPAWHVNPIVIPAVPGLPLQRGPPPLA
jgi:hypothetical protein